MYDNNIEEEVVFLEVVPKDKSTINRDFYSIKSSKRKRRSSYSSSDTESSLDDICSEGGDLSVISFEEGEIPSPLDNLLSEDLLLPEKTTFNPLAPPEPQLPDPDPNNWQKELDVKTPDAKPHATQYWKNGVAIVVPAPPRLPKWIRLKCVHFNDTIDKIKKRLTDDLICDQTLKVSLNCPITNKRVETPSRSLMCHHIDCFDINSFLLINYNKKIDDWKCPKCRQPAKVNLLIIDSLLKHILSHEAVSDPSIESVIFDNKAVWVPDIKLPENFVTKSSDNNVINIVDNTNEEIILLDDEEDDEPSLPVVPPPLKVSPSMPTMTTLAETLGTAKNLEQNLSNLIQKNKNQNPPQTGGTAQQTQKTPSRWSDVPPNTTVHQIPATRPPQPQPITLQMASRPQMGTIAATRPPQPQQITLQMASHTRPQMGTIHPNIQSISLGQVIAINPPNSQRSGQTSQQTQNQSSVRPQSSSTVRTTTTATNPVRTPANQASSNTCVFKFEYKDSLLTSIYCPACCESFPPNKANEHRNSAKHKTRTGVTQQTAVPTPQPPKKTQVIQPSNNAVRTQPQPQNSASNITNNVTNTQRNTNTGNVGTFRPPNRGFNNNSNYPNNNNNTISDQNFNTNNWNYRFPPNQAYAQAYQTLVNQYTGYPPVINNFYSPNGSYIQQSVAPPANQTAPTPIPPPAHNNVLYPNQMSYPYTAPQNQTNGYYNNYR